MENRQPQSPQEIVASGVCCALNANLQALFLEQFQQAIQADLSSKKIEPTAEELVQADIEQVVSGGWFNLGISHYFKKRRLQQERKKAQAIQDITQPLTVDALIKSGCNIDEAQVVSVVKALSQFDKNYKKLLRNPNYWSWDNWLPWRTSTQNCPLFMFINTIKNLAPAGTGKALQANLTCLQEAARLLDLHPALSKRFATLQLLLADYRRTSNQHIENAKDYASQQLASAQSEVTYARRAMNVADSVPIDVAVAAAFPATMAKNTSATGEALIDQQFDCSDLVEQNASVATITRDTFAKKITALISMDCFNPGRSGVHQQVPRKKSIFARLFGSKSDYEVVPQEQEGCNYQRKAQGIVDLLASKDLTVANLMPLLKDFREYWWNKKTITQDGKKALLALTEIASILESKQRLISGVTVAKAVGNTSKVVELAKDNDYARAKACRTAKQLVIDAYGFSDSLSLDTTYQTLLDEARSSPVVAPDATIFDVRFQSALQVKRLLIETVKQVYGGECPLFLEGDAWACSDASLLDFANAVSSASRNLDHPELGGLNPCDQYNLLLIAVALNKSEDKVAITDIFDGCSMVFPYEALQKAEAVGAVVKIKRHLVKIKSFAFGNASELSKKWTQLIKPSMSASGGNQLVAGSPPRRASFVDSLMGKKLARSGDVIREQLRAETISASNYVISGWGSSGREIVNTLEAIFATGCEVSSVTKPAIFMLAMLQWYGGKLDAREENSGSLIAAIAILSTARLALSQVLDGSVGLDGAATSLAALSRVHYKNKEGSSFYKLLAQAKKYAPDLFSVSSSDEVSCGAGDDVQSLFGRMQSV